MILKDELITTDYKSIYDANNRLYKLSNGQYLYVGVYEYVEDEGLDEFDEESLDESKLVDGDIIDWYYCIFDETGTCIKNNRLREYDTYMDMEPEEAAESAIIETFGEDSGITFELATNVEYRNCYPANITIK